MVIQEQVSKVLNNPLDETQFHKTRIQLEEEIEEASKSATLHLKNKDTLENLYSSLLDNYNK